MIMMARTPLHMFGMKYRVQEYLGLLAGGEYDVNAQDAARDGGGTR